MLETDPGKQAPQKRPAALDGDAACQGRLKPPHCVSQQPAVRMFDDWRALAATKGLFIDDPAAQLPDASAAARLFTEAGFKDIEVSAS